jgi:hypothetical protein
MFQTPGDDMLDRVENLVPRSAEYLGRFLPGKPTRPAGQKEHVGFGQSAFAVAPRNFLDDDRLAAATIDAPHGVQQKNQKAPERYKFETPLGELIIPGCGLMAARADGRRTLARTHGYLNTRVIGTETGMPINEAPEMMAAV